MRGGRGRGKSMVPPSVQAALASSQYGNKKQVALANQTLKTAKPPFPPPPTNIPLPDTSDPTCPLSIAIAWHSRVKQLLSSTPMYLTSRQSFKEVKVERYSDRYNAPLKKEKLYQISCPIDLFPAELIGDRMDGKMERVASKFSFAAALAKLDDIKEQPEEEETEDEQEIDEEHYEEEELEDETDYNLSYFDNGEEYGDYDGDDGGEPSY